MNQAKLRVLIADDHGILRSGIKRLLLEMPDIDAVGEAENGAQVLQRMASEHWDVLVLDLDMPGQDSLDILRHVKNNHPDTAVLILTMFPEEQFALRTLKAGAAGYLTKQSAPEHLLTAIRRLGEGGTYISASLAATLAANLKSRRADTLNELLSDREFTVMRGIAGGESITQIAKELNLSAKTVSTYRTRLLIKLNLQSNVELARYAAEHGLVK
jgi:two-component system invasion response regulator UvrY